MDYRLEDLIDLPLFQILQDRLNVIYSFPSAIIDNDGRVLTATAWQDVCTKFHRVHPECAEECRKSDLYILSHIHEAKPAVTYRCPHGLVDNATPIVIGGKHLGNFFTGQFFLEPPDLDFFRRQAQKYGFDEETYLEAVQRVPIWSTAKLEQYLDFIKGFTEILAGIGYKQLQEMEARRSLAAQGAALENLDVLNQQIVESVDEGVIVYGMDLRYRLWNPYMERISGVSAAEAIGRHPLEVFPFLAGAGVIDRVEAALRGEAQPPLDFPYALPDGRSGWTTDTCGPLLDKKGNIVGAIATVIETTARKRAQEALQSSEESLRRAQAIAHIGSWIEELPSGTVLGSDELYRILGAEPHGPQADLLGHWRRALHPQDAERVVASTAAAAAGEGPRSIEYRLVRPDGSIRHVVAITGDSVRDEQGTLIRRTGVLQDITARKEAELERHKLEEQLLQLQRLEAVGRLAGGVAHDFNNMLGAILGNTELALDQLDPDEPAREELLEIQAVALRSADLTRQLLAFARRQTVAPKVLDLNDTVHSMLRMLRRLIGEDIDLEWQPGPDLARIRMDPSQIDQILANLCVNARDAIAGVGQVTITTDNAVIDAHQPVEHPDAVPGRFVRLRVRDSGGGMSADVMANLFEPFFTTKELGQGTGLGLATVYGIVKQNGGFIDVQSSPDHGTTFSIHLPSWAEATEPASPQRDPLQGDPTRALDQTVLLVEDDPALLKVGRRMLASLGLRVLAAATPDQALALAAQHTGRIQLLITDVVLPGMNGRELAQRLRHDQPGLTLLFISGYTADVIAHHGVLEEGVAFLEKPFSGPQLAAKVRAVLGLS